MRISIKKRIGPYKLSIVAGRVTQVWGINSTLENGLHILMWDFDTKEKSVVCDSLRSVQALCELPTIRLARSSFNGGIHAYCLTAKPWLQALAIVALTPGVDSKWVSLCCMRGHWTLRLTNKGQGAPQFLFAIVSGVEENVEIRELNSAVSYEVWKGGTSK